jgi:ligand-binding sensor domain-containing protein
MKRYCMLLPLLAVCIIGTGQNTIGLPQVLNFNNNEFHAGTQTWDIKQDPTGRMYFANNEGLLTYDGSYWKLYPQPDKTILRSIALAGNRIYAGGQDEIGYYAPNAIGALQYTSLKHLIPTGQNKFTDIWEIEVYKESVFFRTWDKIFEYKNEAIQVYKAQIGWQFLKLAGDKLIAQDKHTGLFQFINNQWHPICTQQPATNFEITGIIPINSDSLLISSLQHGLYTLSQGVLRKKNSEADNHFTNHHIYAFGQINSTEYVAGTTSEGCLVINAAGQIVQRIAQPEGLQNNNVLCVFLDREQNLWAGLDNGISFIPYNAPIKYIKPGKPNELAGYSARILNNRLYIATSDGAYGVTLTATDKDLSFSKGDFTMLKNSGGQCWRIDEANNQLLLGHNNGSFLLKDNEATPITGNPGAWLFVPTTPIMPAKQVLVGTYAGLTMFEYTGNTITNTWEIKGPYESRRFLAIDNNNTIWSAHPYRGVYKITLSADNKTYATTLYTDKNGLPSTLRNFVFRIKNRVVFATEKGVYEFDGNAQKFVPSPIFSPIFGNIPLQYLTEDAEGHIWFCSGKKMGVVSFTEGGQKHKLYYFPELTGKILSGFENIYPFSTNNIFIAAGSGIIHLNYEKYILEGAKPNVLLTQAKAFGQSDSVFFGGYFQRNNDSSALQQASSILKFPKSQNSFHFEFSSPSFCGQRNMEYSYWLEGYDKTWSAWTSKTEKDYTNLPDGSYTFKVKAHNNLGAESAVVSYRFVVKPAWYKTVWAYLGYALLFFILLHLLNKWQKKKLLQQRLKFEEEQKRLNYIHQLEMEKTEKEIIKLQNEKLANEVIYKNRELADVSMHLVERSDALIKVKDELQQLYKKTGGNHDVKKAIQLVNDIEKNNTNWEQFAAHFDEVNNDFLKKLKAKFPELTNTDLKVCAYLQLKLASKEIAQLMNISVRGVEISRYRLRKKLQLTAGQSLTDFLDGII